MASSSAPLLQREDLDLAPEGLRSPAHMATTTLKVDGMTCGACTSAVEAAFKGVEGAGTVSVSLIMGRAVVHHDPTILSAEKVAEMIEDRGFDSAILATDLPRGVPQAEEEYEGGNDLLDDSFNTPSVSTTTLKVGGMTCGACTSAVEGGLAEKPGVSSVTVSLLSERAVVEHDISVISPEQIAEIVEDRGFDAEVLETVTRQPKSSSSRGKSASRKGSNHVTTTMSIEGMTCGACTSAVENALKNQPGVVRFNVSLLAERGIAVHDPSILTSAAIAELIENAGFDVRIISSREDDSVQSHTTASLTLNIYGLADSTAAIDLEDALRAVDGVLAADVKLSNSRALISYTPSKVGIRQLVEVVERAGYNALLAESDDSNAQLESLAKTKEIHEWRRAFWFSFSFAVPVMVISMFIPMYIPAIDIGKFELIPGLFSGEIICLLLTIPVQFGIGKRFYISAFKSLKHGAPTMDVLVMLGTSAAFFFSILAMLVSIFFKPHSRPMTVFETSTMLITFITLGRWLENRAKGQTSRALSRLMSLAPSMATIYDDPIAAEKLAEGWGSVPLSAEKDKSTTTTVSTNQRTIPTELIQVGDIVCLRPGDKVPADGVVIRGESYIDEGMITGEAVPIRKIKASQVMAGTVNGTGWVDFRVTRAGRDTQLSQIVKLVQDAQTSRAPIQRMADIVAGYFVPAIITLGLITFFGWMILSHILPNPPKIFLAENSGGTFMVCLKLCISVVVFACPCALGLSTPTAVMVGTGVGAEHGILVKGGAALEAATKVTHVVFDKTGTLTMGKMSVSDIKMESTWSSNDWRRRQWWLVVGLAELTSEHPIGKAILAKARAEVGLSDDSPLNGSVADFEVSVGKGVSAIVEPTSNASSVRHRVLVGNAPFLRSRDVHVPQSAEPEPEPSKVTASISTRPRKNSEHAAGSTLIHVAIDGKYAGTITLQDTLKPTAAAAVTALHRMGLTTSLITGDSISTALAVASAVGIPASSVHASVIPSEKQSIIASLQESPSTIVAMVGDGINDSPALATASVGIALASGTDVAMEAADIVLMRSDDLLSVPASLCLARSIFRRIKLNLLWACMYNAVGIPFAMGLFLPFGGISLHPMAAGAAMAASSVSVVVSSLLLKFWKRPGWLDAEKLEREAELGLIDSSGLGRGGRGLWWRKSPITHDRRGRVRRTFSRLVTLGSDAVMNIAGKRRNPTDDEGYVPLRTVEPVSA
ncbi:Cu2+-exporting ATPase [Blastomyces parvus]|uniref:P-type Cu(+) transporter n=1 Tax=Blastomyces parvus TaxID=2060905 RepID=A0A2B7WYD5_9EURO|nr:Cu2+-exporting ATPase [Blastomyces parvus]